MGASNAKPLTKALHTVRVVGRLARLWCVLRPAGKAMPVEPECAAFAFALETIGNACPIDPTLRDDCLEACKRAVIEWQAEQVELDRRLHRNPVDPGRLLSDVITGRVQL